MSPLVLDPPSGAPVNTMRHSGVGGGAVGVAHQNLIGIDVHIEPQEDFDREKQAFVTKLSPAVVAQHAGRFVAARGGNIVDSDSDLSVLTARFFAKHGDVPVYIVRIGQDQDDLRIDTPFFDED